MKPSNEAGPRAGSMRSIAREIGGVAFFALFAGLGHGTAVASTELVAGFETGGPNSYAFVSPMFAFPLGKSDDLIVKPAVNYLRYETREDGETASVRAPGASIGLSYRHRGPKLTFDIGPSLEVTRERRTLPVGGRTTDKKLGVALSANAFYQADRNNTLSLLTNYSQTSRYFWSRAGLKNRITNRDYKGPVGLSVGPEGTFQTGRGVTQVGAGIMTEIGLDRAATSVQFRAGYSRSKYSEGRDSNPYFGAGLYRRF